MSRRTPRSFRCRRCKHAFGHGPTCQECGVGRYQRKMKRVSQLRPRLVY